MFTRFVAVTALALSGLALGQSLSLKPSTIQHVKVASGVDGMVRPGGRVVLWVLVTPDPGKRVYAPGAGEFLPVALVMTPHGAIAAARPAFPQSELDPNSGGTTPVPVYRKPFRIAVPIVVNAATKHGETLTLAAALNYQACDDRLCYPAASIPVLWTIGVL